MDCPTRLSGHPGLGYAVVVPARGVGTRALRLRECRLGADGRAGSPVRSAPVVRPPRRRNERSLVFRWSGGFLSFSRGAAAVSGTLCRRAGGAPVPGGFLRPRGRVSCPPGGLGQLCGERERGAALSEGSRRLRSRGSATATEHAGSPPTGGARHGCSLPWRSVSPFDVVFRGPATGSVTAGSLSVALVAGSGGRHQGAAGPRQQEGRGCRRPARGSGVTRTWEPCPRHGRPPERRRVPPWPRSGRRGGPRRRTPRWGCPGRRGRGPPGSGGCWAWRT
ncbi:hypothetical protein FHX37_0968 [Haloactinospora alba]|uniref:Uncharacterized protein n=1 Tax=Haloactinospora alba TaxID=405555 RepID=A0A543NGZ7_9ACTN|nr:hypothetical protein FHX37_0968 [Haloactinospora alba]